MANEEALKFCRYYHGEPETPFDLDDIKSTYWSIEETWIKLVVDNETRSDNLLLPFMVDFGGMDYVHIPVTLKATIYDQFCHFGGSKGEFMDFLLAYLAE